MKHDASARRTRILSRPIADYPTVDWSKVHLDPSTMSPRAREGYEFLIDYLAHKLIELQSQPKTAAERIPA